MKPSWQVTKLMLWYGPAGVARVVGEEVVAAVEPRASGPAPCPDRPGRSGGRRRGSGRSTAARAGRGSASRAGRRRPRPRARRSGGPRAGPGRSGSRSAAGRRGRRSDPSVSRVSTEARSNRKPSTCISVTQYRRLSRIMVRTCAAVSSRGCCRSRSSRGTGGRGRPTQVVGRVVDPPEAVGRPRLVPLGRVVVDDVEDDLDVRLVQGLDHRPELVARRRPGRRRRAGGGRRSSASCSPSSSPPAGRTAAPGAARPP